MTVSKFGPKVHTSASVQRKRGTENNYRTKGKFKIQHRRGGLLLAEYDLPNGVTNGGIDNILDVAFNAGTPITTWYIGMIDAAGFSALAAGDTMASHAGWTEFTAYSEGTRPAWGVGAPSAQAITNAVPEDFNITGGAASLKGTFLASANVKGGSGGILWATATFASDIPVTGGDLIKVTYTTAGS